jgi:hypothetical protein
MAARAVTRAPAHDLPCLTCDRQMTERLAHLGECSRAQCQRGWRFRQLRATARRGRHLGARRMDREEQQRRPGVRRAG